MTDPDMALFRLRSYCDADAEFLPDVYQAAVRGLGKHDYPPEQVEAWANLAPSTEGYRRRAADGRSVWIAADPNGRPVAYADLEPDGHIDHLYCHPDASGRGVGAALLMTLETLARSRDLPKLYVEASETARPLFERLGFSTGYRRDIERNGVGLRNYSMSRDLSDLTDGRGPTPATNAVMAKFVAETGLGRIAPLHQVVEFGDSPEMMDDLAQLALSGTKQATASLLRDYATGEPMPYVGCFAVLLNGVGTPCAIWRTTELLIGPLIAVDEAFAWDEGEGDRTRSDWLAMHRRYFSRVAMREGFLFHDHIPTVFERFKIACSIGAVGLGR